MDECLSWDTGVPVLWHVREVPTGSPGLDILVDHGTDDEFTDDVLTLRQGDAVLLHPDVSDAELMIGPKSLSRGPEGMFRIEAFMVDRVSALFLSRHIRRSHMMFRS
jgi:hypothetical protein